MDKDKQYNVSISGGKDSVATAIIMLEQNYDFQLHYSHFYFDKSKNIPAILPEHHDFIFNVLKPYFEERGVKFIVHEPQSDYVTEYFKVKKYGKNVGDILGFPIPIANKCWCNSRLKLKKLNLENSVLGIAYDETERLKRLIDNINTFSILAELQITENECMKICEKHGLLSPIYLHSKRDGCWFCNQMSIASSQYINNKYPELIAELIDIEKYCKYDFARNHQSVIDFYNRKYKREKR